MHGITLTIPDAIMAKGTMGSIIMRLMQPIRNRRMGSGCQE
jgi:hypothetical protein